MSITDKAQTIKASSKATSGKARVKETGVVKATVVRGDIPEDVFMMEEFAVMFRSWRLSNWRTKVNEDGTTWTSAEILFTFRDEDLAEETKTKPSVRLGIDDNGSVYISQEKGEYQGHTFKKAELRDFFLSKKDYPQRQMVSKQAFMWVKMLLLKGIISAPAA